MSAMSSQVSFSRNEFVVDVHENPKAIVHAQPAPRIWTPTDSGRDLSPRMGVWYPENSKFLLSFPPACIPILKSIAWRFTNYNVHEHYVAFSHERIADWNSTIDLIAENVELSRLTITLDMTRSRLADEVMDPVKKLKGLGGLFVRLPRDLDTGTRTAEERRLERLAMGERYNPSEEELKAWKTKCFSRRSRRQQ
jgi:hypothetical protein